MADKKGTQKSAAKPATKQQKQKPKMVSIVVFQIIYAPILHFIYNHFQDYLECHITLFKPNYAR